MEDDESKPPRTAVGNRTIQIDALTDVELVDNRIADAAREAAGRAPPPLPRKQAAAPRSTAKIVGFVVALGLGALSALAIVHFLFPSTAPQAATAAAPTTAPPTTAPTITAPTTTPEAAPSGDVRHVHMDEELVIRPDDPPPSE